MKYQIYGTTMQTLDVHLAQGEAVYTESGGMAWMKGNIKMETNARGGLMKSLRRTLAGESLFMTTYNCAGTAGVITFTPEAPGKILPFTLNSGQSRVCQRDSFMCAETSVKLEIHFRKKLGAGLFGGEGVI